MVDEIFKEFLFLGGLIIFLIVYFENGVNIYLIYYYSKESFFI